MREAIWHANQDAWYDTPYCSRRVVLRGPLGPSMRRGVPTAAQASAISSVQIPRLRWAEGTKGAVKKHRGAHVFEVKEQVDAFKQHVTVLFSETTNPYICGPHYEVDVESFGEASGSAAPSLDLASSAAISANRDEITDSVWEEQSVNNASLE